MRSAVEETNMEVTLTVISGFIFTTTQIVFITARFKWHRSVVLFSSFEMLMS